MGSKKRNKKNVSKKSEVIVEDICALCDIKSDEPYLGQLIKQSGIALHENCLFFSPVLHQELDPSVKRKGYILGFKISDIDKEIKRICRLKCFVCRKKKAGVGCCMGACKRSFHLSCGLKFNAVGIFTDSFTFYCNEHAEHQDLTEQIAMCEKVVPECAACLESMVDEDTGGPNITDELRWEMFIENIENRQVIHGQCCNRVWLHRACMVKYGLSAGLHHVKCPNCSNKSTFLETCMKFGIWVPDRDASWEMEPGAFQDMYTDQPPIDEDHSINEEVTVISDETEDINDENQKPPIVDNSNISPGNTHRINQSDIRIFLTQSQRILSLNPAPSPAFAQEPVSSTSRKRIMQRSSSVGGSQVPIKRRRRSNDAKPMKTVPLVTRNCSKCSRSLVCFSVVNESDCGGNKPLLVSKNNNNNQEQAIRTPITKDYICISCIRL